jgi:hypothetical protein
MLAGWLEGHGRKSVWRHCLSRLREVARERPSRRGSEGSNLSKLVVPIPGWVATAGEVDGLSR